jgi:hypothetical protein
VHPSNCKTALEGTRPLPVLTGTNKGLHIDVYRDGETYRQEYVAPPMPAGVATDFAEDQLTENVQRFTRRFEEWHEIGNR